MYSLVLMYFISPLHPLHTFSPFIKTLVQGSFKMFQCMSLTTPFLEWNKVVGENHLMSNFINGILIPILYYNHNE